MNGGNVWQHMLTRMPMGIIMHALFSLVLLTIHKSRTNHNQESIKYTVDELYVNTVYYTERLEIIDPYFYVDSRI